MANNDKNPVDIEAMRHSASHVLAEAVLEMFPEAKLAIGPAIENGFYYDFDLPRTLIPEDLPILEKKMKHIIKQNQKFEKYEEPIDKGIEFLKKTKQIYKVEMAEDLKKEGEKTLSFYKTVLPQTGEGAFVDMCAGPHIEHTGRIGAFKLTKIAGAYWRGNEKNKMLQRIYGLAFHTKEELDDYLKMLDEAQKRDHRKIGQELDLFSFHDEGPGFPFWHPKGMRLRNTLINFWRDMHVKAGYEEVNTPIILREQLWHQSGHWDNYKENMYFTEIDDEAYAIKPMNCPGGITIYKDRLHSYKEFPLRWAELGLVHRHELSGVLHGLFRVRSFTQDDAHIYCMESQIKDELKRAIALVDSIYKVFGFDYHIELSTRPEKSIGSDEIWEHSEKIMKEVMEELKIEYQLNEGDGAFYGPKFDFHLSDCIGRTWQCGTIQLDFSMPERFEMEYTAEDGSKKRPVMLHRTCLGSIERFIGVITEHFAGAFPAWLAPVQVRVIPVAEPYNQYAKQVQSQLENEGFKVETDEGGDSLGKKIRNAELQKVPYMLICGGKEAESNSVASRSYKTKKQEVVDTDKFIKMLKKEVEEKS